MDSHDGPGGEAIRQIRLRLGLTLREVEQLGRAVAERYGDPRYCLPVSRLSELESGQATPNIHKLFSLSVIYDRPILELLVLFGVDAYKQTSCAELLPELPTHPADISPSSPNLRLPVRLDPSFTLRQTLLLNRFIQEWREVPPELLALLRLDRFMYVRIGQDDNPMHPLLRSGSLLRVDTNRTQVVNSGWNDEYDRPLYVLATLKGYRCGWCQLEGKQMILVPHPASRCPFETYNLEKDVEVIGQAIALWTTLGPPD